MTSTPVEIAYARYFLQPGEAAAFAVAMLGNVTDSRYGSLVFRASQHADVTDTVKRLLAHVGAASARAGRPRQRSSQWLRVLTDRTTTSAPGTTVDVAEVSYSGASSVYVMVCGGEGAPARRLALDLDIAYRTDGEVHAAWVTQPLHHEHGDEPVGLYGAVRVLGLAAQCRACADGFYAGEGAGDFVLDDAIDFYGLHVTDTGFDDQRGEVAYVGWDDERWHWPGHVRGVDPNDDLLAGSMPKVLVSNIEVSTGGAD